MNLRQIANGVTQTVNPNTSVTWMRSTGFSTSEDFQQVPEYESTTVLANVQALSGSDLQHINGLNIQGTMRKVYLYGDVKAISRPDATGADLLVFPQDPASSPQTWLVSQVMETWPDWCCVIVTLQTDD